MAGEIRDSYHRTIEDILGKVVFVRDILFNLVSVVDQQAITTKKQHQVKKHQESHP